MYLKSCQHVLFVLPFSNIHTRRAAVTPIVWPVESVPASTSNVIGQHHAITLVLRMFQILKQRHTRNGTLALRLVWREVVAESKNFPVVVYGIIICSNVNMG